MATKKQAKQTDEEQTAREPEQQVRRKPRPDPSAVNQSYPYDPAAAYARAPEMGGSNQALAGVEGGAGGPGGATAAAPDVVAGGVGAASGTAAAGTGSAG